MRTAIRLRSLRIDGMYDASSEHTVRAALKDVPGVTTESTRVGGATIESDDEGATAACAALNAAGFRAWETRAPGDRYRTSTRATTSGHAGIEPVAPGRAAE